jgi:hypothetical protein
MGFSRQFQEDLRPILTAQIGELRFEEAWLRTLARKNADCFVAIHVTGREMSDLLLPDDHALVDCGDKTIWPGDEGLFLVRCDDRLTFARCPRDLGPPRKLSIEQAKRATPRIDPSALTKATVLGRVVHFGRTLPTSKAFF